MKYIKIAVSDDFDSTNNQIWVQNDTKHYECDVWKPTYRDMLDKGFLGLVDFMGGDDTVVNAARVSYGTGTKRVSEDRNLIRYLIRNRHWTPVEMVEVMWHVKAPIFVYRQWHRHRMACLAGDVKLTFDLPGGVERKGNQAYTLTVGEVYNRFQPTQSIKRPDRQKNAYHKRDRVQGMLLRSCDVDSLTPYHTQIVNIWESGIKPIIQVEFEHGGILRATADHQCFTNMGWMRLEDAINSNALFAATGKCIGYTSFDPEFTPEELHDEYWSIIPCNPKYEASTLGRIRCQKNPILKNPTPTPQGYRVISLSENSKSTTHLVHHLVMSAFGRVRLSDEQTRHLDNNRANNRLDNLSVGTAFENCSDRMDSGNSQRLSIVFVKPTLVQNDNTEMTYDIEVVGPYHNFLAGGVFVHNSINEYSARYSEMSEDIYMPDASVMKPQSTTNKQGRDGDLSENNINACQIQLQHAYQESSQAYNYLLGKTATPSTSLNRRHELVEEFAMQQVKRLGETNHDWNPGIVTNDMLDDKLSEIITANGLAFTDDEFHEQGLSRELARICMPLGTYSEMYWKSDLRNTFNFIGLRSDPHAQYEIRVYSDAMLEMLTPIAPVCVAAFIDYQLNGRQFSRFEVEIVRYLYQHLQSEYESGAYVNVSENIASIMKDDGASKREIDDFLKMVKA